MRLENKNNPCAVGGDATSVLASVTDRLLERLFFMSQFITWAIERYDRGQWIPLTYHTDRAVMELRLIQFREIYGDDDLRITEVTSRNEQNYLGDPSGW